MAENFSQRLLLNGGVNLTADPRVLGENELVQSRNMFPNVSGVMETRPGTTPVFDIGVSVMPAMYIPDKSTGFALVIASVDPSFGVILTAYQGLDAATTAIQLVPEAAAVPNALNYNGETLFTFGYPFEGTFTLSKNGWRRDTFNLSAGIIQPQTVPVTPKVSGTYFKRVVWGNFGPGRENVILFADEDNITFRAKDYNTTIAMVVGTDALEGYDIALDHLAGDEVTAIQQISLADNANPMQSALLVLGKQRGVILTGETLETVETPPASGSYFGSLSPNALSRDCGCFGARAICSTPEGVFWAGQDNVWFLPSGASPQPIGFKILPILRAVAAGDYDRAVLMYHDHRIILGLPAGTEIAPDVISTPRSQPTLEFWWLDLKQGVQDPKWYGPMVYTTVGYAADMTGGLMCAARRNVSGEAPECLAISTTSDAGVNPSPTYNSTVVRMLSDSATQAKDVVGQLVNSYDAPKWQPTTSYEVGDRVRPLFMRCGATFVCEVAGTSDVLEPSFGVTFPVVDGSVEWSMQSTQLLEEYASSVNNVTGSIITKAFDFAAPQRRKTVKKVEAELYVDAPQQVVCNDIQNLGRTSEAMTMVLGNNDNAVLSFGLPLNIAKDFSHRSFRPEDGSILVAEHHQLEFTHSAGYVVDETNDTICVCAYGIPVDYTAIPFGYTEATIPQQVYATDQDLMAAIVAALNANAATLAANTGTSGITWSALKQSGVWTLTSTFNAGTLLLDGVGFALLFGWAEITSAPTISPDPSPLVPQPDQSNTVKCGRLFNMLGFDAAARFSDLMGQCFDTSGAGVRFNDPAVDAEALVPRGMDGLLNETTTLWADTQVGITNPVGFAITEAEVFGTTFGGPPLTNRNR